MKHGNTESKELKEANAKFGSCEVMPDSVMTVDEKTGKAVEKYREISLEMDRLKLERSAYEAAIKTAMGATETLVDSDGWPLVIWKAGTFTKKVDVEGLVIAAKIPDELLQEFTTVTPKARAFSVK